MKEAYVKYETAQLLKEKGFRGDCIAYYNDDGKRYISLNAELHPLPCPTQAVACRWLREEHGIMITPDRDKIVNVAPEPFYDYWCTIRHNGNEYWVSSLDLPDAQHYTEYEDVVEAALQYCLTNLI